MENFNYTGNILLGNDNNDRLQSFYSSQSYGTSYSVFGSINIEDNITQKSAKLKSINLKLINYKGLLNMELINYEIKFIQFEKIALLNSKNTSKKIKNKVIDLKIFVKAATVSEPNLTLSIDNKDIVNVKINQGDILLIRRELLSIYAETKEELDQRVRRNSSGQKEPLWNPTLGGIFDNEFYYRNGKLLGKRMDGDFALIDENDKENFDKTILMIVDGSPSCHMRASIINIL